MTQKFDNFLKNVLEAISFQENGLLPEEYNNFPDVKSEYLVNGIYLDDWDLKDFSEFKNLLKKADSEKKYIFGQAYPYLTKDRMREQGKNREEIEKEFVKDRNRLLNMYSKFGFIHTRNGWIYRKPFIVQEKAFHASPYNISDKFDLKFVGKGEGNKAFGWGLYFAENPLVSKEYGDLFYDRGHEEIYIYDVEIDVKEDELLDLDKKIDEQSSFVKEKIKYAVEHLRKYSWKEFEDFGRVIDPQGNVTKDIIAFNEQQLKEVQYGNGKNFYEFLENYSGSQKEASLALLKQGIKGLKYFDYKSREKGQGTRNFVIFDDNLVKINGKTPHHLQEMTDASVFGSDGPYPTSDARVPTVLGTYTRNGKVKKRRRKKKKKN